MPGSGAGLIMERSREHLVLYDHHLGSVNVTASELPGRAPRGGRVQVWDTETCSFGLSKRLFPPNLIEPFLNHFTHSSASLRREVQGTFSRFLMTSRHTIKDSFVLTSRIAMPPETENYFTCVLLNQRATRFFF